ncbi:MAG: septum formation protein Maf [Clostridia bacterium]|nr:septum formation protein Maf [Clostridia bacterium]
MKIILASGSPRRKELLSKLVKDYEIIKSDFDETELKEKEKNPEKLVKQLSVKKAESVLSNIKENYKDFTIIAADTIVYFNGNTLGKPKDEKDAFNMLQKLQGKDNYIYTGMTVIINKNDKLLVQTIIDKITVTMKKLTDKEIIDYIDTKDPLDKAGAYAIQGIGSKNIEKCEGNYNAGIGLNIEVLEKIFKENGII